MRTESAVVKRQLASGWRRNANFRRCHERRKFKRVGHSGSFLAEYLPHARTTAPTLPGHVPLSASLIAGRA